MGVGRLRDDHGRWYGSKGVEGMVRGYGSREVVQKMQYRIKNVTI
jgi:hypothetical protein